MLTYLGIPAEKEIIPPAALFIAPFQAQVSLSKEKSENNASAEHRNYYVVTSPSFQGVSE
jgi:hypothetical protein